MRENLPGSHGSNQTFADHQDAAHSFPKSGHLKWNAAFW